jgi:hypothetical protein
MKLTFLFDSVFLLISSSLPTTLGFSQRGVGFNNRKLQQDFGINGTTAEEVCNSVLNNSDLGFEEEDTELLQTECTCEPTSAGGYSASCVDKCEWCNSGVCYRFVMRVELDAELLVEEVQYCSDFNDAVYDGVIICQVVDFTGEGNDSYTVDGQECASTEDIECQDNEFSPLVDCSNLGYGSDINFCEEGTVEEGPFGFLRATYSGNSTVDCGDNSSPTSAAQTLVVVVPSLFVVTTAYLLVFAN